MVWGVPSSRIWKSSRGRPLTVCPFLGSVTTTSSATTWVRLFNVIIDRIGELPSAGRETDGGAGMWLTGAEDEPRGAVGGVDESAEDGASLVATSASASAAVNSGPLAS